MTIVYDTIVTSGQSFNVDSPTSAYYTTVYAGGNQFVNNGSYAYGTVVVSGGLENVDPGGSDAFSLVYSGGSEYVLEGVSYDAGIYGSAGIASGGVASN